MLNKEWPAEDYAIGSYVQATIVDDFLPRLIFNPNDKVLDVGCGDGGYTKKILRQVPQGSVLGIDPSQNMLHLAQEVRNEYPNFSLKQEDILDIQYSNQFDKVVSFWCLQWVVDIKKAFANINSALKPGGKIFAIFPSGNDPFINGYYALKKMDKFSSLKNFKPPMDYSRLDNLEMQLNTIPYKNIKLELHTASIVLPSLDIFRRFVNGIAFYQGQVSDEELIQINENLVTWYQNECQKNWKGELRFNLSLYLVSGEK